jgi:hypothetical protein
MEAIKNQKQIKTSDQEMLGKIKLFCVSLACICATALTTALPGMAQTNNTDLGRQSNITNINQIAPNQTISIQDLQSIRNTGVKLTSQGFAPINAKGVRERGSVSPDLGTALTQINDDNVGDTMIRLYASGGGENDISAKGVKVKWFTIGAPTVLNNLKRVITGGDGKLSLSREKSSANIAVNGSDEDGSFVFNREKRDIAESQIGQYANNNEWKVFKHTDDNGMSRWIAIKTKFNEKAEPVLNIGSQSNPQKIRVDMSNTSNSQRLNQLRQSNEKQNRSRGSGGL